MISYSRHYLSYKEQTHLTISEDLVPKKPFPTLEIKDFLTPSTFFRSNYLKLQQIPIFLKNTIQLEVYLETTN